MDQSGCAPVPGAARLSPASGDGSRACLTFSSRYLDASWVRRIFTCLARGIDDLRDGRQVRTGGVEWTIKDGIPYHAPTLMARVKQIVAQARQR